LNEDDRLAARAVLEKTTFAPGRVKLIEERLEPALLQACYGLMDLFIATRLHSGIFSLNMGVPTIFIGYLPKSRGVLEAVGLSDCLVELKSIDEEELFRKLEMAWLERDELSRRISRTLPGILADAVRPMQQIHQDYFIKKG
jgi:colanic acid/amylovoran biosynthesis protein